MPWVKVDDGFHDHPKVKAIGLDGAGLLISLTTWSSRHLTDGVVPEQVIREMCGHPKRFQTLLQTLLKNKCLRRCPGGTTKRYAIHDYLDYQDPAEVIKARRAAEREKKRKQRRSAVGLSPDGSPGGTAGVEKEVSRPPDPTRPAGSGFGVGETSEQQQHGDVADASLEPNALVDRCIAIGVSRKVAADLVKADPEAVAQQLAWLPQRASHDQAAVLVSAVRSNWGPPTKPTEARREIPWASEVS
jgi:hypothetical protein